MSLITRNAKEYQSVTAQLMSQNLPIVSCSFGIFCVLRHPNHFVLAAQTMLVITRIPSRTNNEKEQSPTLSRASCVTVHLMQIGLSQ